MNTFLFVGSAFAAAGLGFYLIVWFLTAFADGVDDGKAYWDNKNHHVGLGYLVYQAGRPFGRAAARREVRRRNRRLARRHNS